MRTVLLCVFLSLTTLPSFVPATAHVAGPGPRAGTWRLDPARSVVQFTVTKLGFADVTGQFLSFSGTIRYDPAEPGNSSVEWKVQIASVRTDDQRRDQSLQAPEYFDATRHPEMSFRSERVRALGAGRLEVEGPLTIKGQTRPLTAAIEPAGGGFETRFELNRYDFGIVGGTVMRRLIGRTVRVRLVAAAGQEGS